MGTGRASAGRERAADPRRPQQRCLERPKRKKSETERNKHPPTSQSPVCRMSEHCSGESRVPARAGGHAETKLFAYVNVGARAPWESLIRFYDTSSQVQDLRGSQARAVFASCQFGGSRGPDAFVQSARPHGAPPEPPDRGHSAGRSSSAVGATERRLGPSAPRARPTTRLAAGGMSGRGAAPQVGGPRARRPPARPPQARLRTAAFSGGPFWARLKPCRPPARVSSAPSF